MPRVSEADGPQPPLAALIRRVAAGAVIGAFGIYLGYTVGVLVLNGVHYDCKRATRVCNHPNGLGRGVRLAQLCETSD